jgi:hypothetical protein
MEDGKRVDPGSDRTLTAMPFADETPAAASVLDPGVRLVKRLHLDLDQLLQ